MTRAHLKTTIAYSVVAKLLVLTWANAVFAGAGGTTLSVSKTAEGARTATFTYNWTLTKTTFPSQTTVVVPPGQSGNLPFTITATRGTPTVVNQGSVTGEICVNNTGNAPTIGLRIVDVVEYFDGTSWQPFPPAPPQNIPVPNEIAAGATQCYPYQFTNLLAGVGSVLPQLRNHAIISIDNYVGHEGTSFSSDAIQPFTFSVTNINIDDTATLNDVFSCPTGFTCSATPLTTNLTGTLAQAYTVTLTNVSAACGQTISPLNQAALTQNTTGTVRSASASIPVYTGTCSL